MDINTVQLNNKIREDFTNWYLWNNEPNLKLVAKEIGIAHTSFISWGTHKRNFNEESLSRIKKYFTKLEEQQEYNLELINKLAD
ncbi:hypothetical protein AALF85_05295 [Jeotgalicoccus halotolerans]|uniref:hypothetical protein n=1 Tax=Jeotgalicoccus halotolerans TaxID=157227 RepID=UPI00351749EB